MQPKKHERGSGDLFRARLDQIINMRHELVQLAGKIDWEFIDGEIAPLYSDSGRPGIATRFVIGLFFAQAYFLLLCLLGSEARRIADHHLGQPDDGVSAAGAGHLNRLQERTVQPCV
jgi:hypothetical protein